jgi:hypothetical protein
VAGGDGLAFDEFVCVRYHFDRRPSSGAAAPSQSIVPVALYAPMAYIGIMSWPLVTVVETDAFVARARSRMNDGERQAAIDMIATDPACGDVIIGGGGIRKVRFGIGGRGKSGGVRIIYYYHSEHLPVFLLTVFAKNEQADLSMAERNALAKAAKQIAKAYRA